MPRGPSTPTSIARAWAAPPQLSCNPGAEFQNPAPHRFIGNLQAALGQEILNVAVAQCETEVQPNCVLDNRGREAVPAIGELIHAESLPHQVARPNSVSVTMPLTIYTVPLLSGSLCTGMTVLACRCRLMHPQWRTTAVCAR